MLGSLMMLGITPGPLLFSNSTDKVYIIILGLLVANIFMCLLGYCGMRGFAKISNMPLRADPHGLYVLLCGYVRL